MGEGAVFVVAVSTVSELFSSGKTTVYT